MSRSREHRADHAGNTSHKQFVRPNPMLSFYQDPENPNWTYFGTGSAGAKADWLYDKSPIIRANGFIEDPRTVLRMGLFEDHRNRNGLDRAIRNPEILGHLGILHSTVLLTKGKLKF